MSGLKTLVREEIMEPSCSFQVLILDMDCQILHLLKLWLVVDRRGWVVTFVAVGIAEEAGFDATQEVKFVKRNFDQNKYPDALLNI
jgi:hypothetical protein